VIINLSYLEDITGGDRAMVLEMLDLFIRDIPVHIEKIETLYTSQNLVDLAKEAHKLKPTLQYIGLTGMFEDIKLLEEIAKSGFFDEPKLKELVERLKESTIKCVPALISKREELS